MSNEKAPKRKKLLPEGWRDFTIVGCKETESKAKNPMFVFTLRDAETGYEDEVYAIATEGKRWFLKMILAACDCPASKDGVYDWDDADVLNKAVYGLVEHEDNEFINRDGETIKAKQHRIVEVKKWVISEEEQKLADAWKAEQQ